MSYSAVRRPSVLGRLGTLVSSIVSVAVIYWFVFTAVRANRGDLFWWLIEGALSLVVGLVLHEGGHLVIGLATGEPVRKIRIGSGATLFGFRVGGLIVQVCMNPIGGGAVYFSGFDAIPGRAHLASLAAGPGTNLVAIIYGLGLYRAGVTWLGPFVLANVILFVSSAVPAVTREGGREHPSDGMQILNLLLKPAIPKTYYEGAEMTRDALAVVVRAMESAQIAGASEVTDMDLLRALDQDLVVGALFGSAGLGPQIPAARTPELANPPRPAMATAANEALVQAFRKSRDLGVQKPNAAGICLGLLMVDCPAARLMRGAGIMEEAVTRLASVTSEDEEDLRRARVISADLPVERWGTAADRILASAMRIAAADHSTFVGTQHLIAAIVADPGCRAARALERLRFVLVWKKGAAELGVEPLVEGIHAVISPQAALAIGGALWRTGATYPTGSAELCLGILDQSAGIGAQILSSAGVTVRSLERAFGYTPRETSEPAGCTDASRGMWMFRAGARIGAGRWLDARADFAECERTATSDEQRAVTRNNMAWTSLMSGNPAFRAEALEQARFAAAFKPDNASFVGTLAFALLENGFLAEAAPMLESIIPKQARPRTRASDLCVLAMCQARLGRPDAAAKSLAAAVEADSRCLLLARVDAELNTKTAPSIA